MFNFSEDVTDIFTCKMYYLKFKSRIIYLTEDSLGVSMQDIYHKYQLLIYMYTYMLYIFRHFLFLIKIFIIKFRISYERTTEKNVLHWFLKNNFYGEYFLCLITFSSYWYTYIQTIIFIIWGFNFQINHYIKKKKKKHICSFRNTNRTCMKINLHFICF